MIGADFSYPSPVRSGGVQRDAQKDARAILAVDISDDEFWDRCLMPALRIPFTSALYSLRYFTTVTLLMVVFYAATRKAFDVVFLAVFVFVYSIPLKSYSIYLNDNGEGCSRCSGRYTVLIGPHIRILAFVVHLVPLITVTWMTLGVDEFRRDYAVDKRTAMSLLLITIYAVLAKPDQLYANKNTDCRGRSNESLTGFSIGAYELATVAVSLSLSALWALLLSRESKSSRN